MRKTILLCLMLVSGICAMAQQRYANLNVKLVTPVTGDLVYPNQHFQILARIYNLGQDTVHITDSSMFQLYFDGYPISFGSSSGNFDSFLVDNILLVPGDSTDFSFGFTIDTSWAPGTTTICTGYTPFNTPGNIHDTILSNNKACATVTIINTTGIANANKQAHSSVSVYPNPASTEANIKLGLKAEANTSYRIMDLAGRVVMQENKGLLQPGDHTFTINTGMLSKGTYLYQVTTGTEVQNGRLLIQ